MYLSAFKKEVAKEVEPGYWTWFCDINEVRADMDEQVLWWKEKINADHHIYCLSDDHNFRKDILPTYKGNRRWMRRPVVLKELKKDLVKKGALLYPNLEGDDVMGMWATDPYRTDDYVIVSIDKDMKTIPGKRWVKDEVVVTSEEEADFWHLYQTLIGDPGDGYTGCPGVGPVAANKVLKMTEGMTGSDYWREVIKVYEKNGLKEEDALTQARCARILRWSDYNHEKHEPILWTP